MEVNGGITGPGKMNVDLIEKTLTEENSDRDSKLETVQSFKRLYSNASNKILANVRLESLLESAFVGHEKSCKSLEKDFLYQYGISLVNFMGKKPYLDSLMLSELKFALVSLKDQDETLMTSLVEYLYRQFESNCIFYPDFMRKLLELRVNEVIENIVLDWVEGSTRVSEYYVRLSSELPEFFQMVTGILFEILVRSNGHPTIFSLTSSFVTSVLSFCENERKLSLGLYPTDCCRLVTLLSIPPEVYPKAGEPVSRNTVISLLFDEFVKNRRKALLLCSHFPNWLSHLKVYVDENESRGEGRIVEEREWETG